MPAADSVAVRLPTCLILSDGAIESRTHASAAFLNSHRPAGRIDARRWDCRIRFVAFLPDLAQVGTSPTTRARNRTRRRRGSRTAGCVDLGSNRRVGRLQSTFERGIDSLVIDLCMAEHCRLGIRGWFGKEQETSIPHSPPHRNHLHHLNRQSGVQADFGISFACFYL